MSRPLETERLFRFVNNAVGCSLLYSPLESSTRYAVRTIARVHYHIVPKDSWLVAKAEQSLLLFLPGLGDFSSLTSPIWPRGLDSRKKLSQLKEARTSQYPTHSY
jgi:hypothetical protein